MRRVSKYGKRNKNKHKIKLGLLKGFADKTYGQTSKILIGHNLNIFGTVGKGIDKYDKTKGYQKARTATFIAKKKNPNMTSKEMNKYHYNVRFKDDIKNGTFKFGWLKSLFKK